MEDDSGEDGDGDRPAEKKRDEKEEGKRKATRPGTIRYCRYKHWLGGGGLYPVGWYLIISPRRQDKTRTNDRIPGSEGRAELPRKISQLPKNKCLLAGRESRRERMRGSDACRHVPVVWGPKKEELHLAVFET